MDKLLLTPVEAGHVLGIGRSKIYELMRAGILRSVRLDNCRRIPVDDLVALVEQLRDAAAPSSARPPVPAAATLATGPASSTAKHRAAPSDLGVRSAEQSPRRSQVGLPATRKGSPSAQTWSR